MDIFFRRVDGGWLMVPGLEICGDFGVELDKFWGWENYFYCYCSFATCTALVSFFVILGVDILPIACIDIFSILLYILIK